MGAGRRIRQIIKDSEMKFKEFAELYNPDSKATEDTKPQVVANMLTRDNMTFATVEKMLEILDCDIVFVNRKTGKTY